MFVFLKHNLRKLSNCVADEVRQPVVVWVKPDLLPAVNHWNVVSFRGVNHSFIHTSTFTRCVQNHLRNRGAGLTSGWHGGMLSCSWFGRPEHGDTCESLPPNLLISWLLLKPSIWQEDKSNELWKTKSLSNCEALISRYLKHRAMGTESLGNPLHVLKFRALRYSHTHN